MGDDSRIEKMSSWGFVARPARFVQIAQIFSQNLPPFYAYCTKSLPLIVNKMLIKCEQKKLKKSKKFSKTY